MIRVLIVGSGDVARRLYPLLATQCRIHALVRNSANALWWRQHGAMPVMADLDRPSSLARLAGLADWVVHLAPPPTDGKCDQRTRNLLAALASGGRVPHRLVYISTTGVYGDLRGAWADETSSGLPGAGRSDRALRRMDAEAQVRRFAIRTRCRASILRVPGIYAADRLPVGRLRSGTVSLSREVDSYSNHIHANDLARAIVAALRRGRCNRVYNVVDDSDLKMGDYFDAVADACTLPRPLRLSAEAARKAVSATMWSYMVESRRLKNRRLKQELRFKLRYPTVHDALQQMKFN